MSLVVGGCYTGFRRSIGGTGGVISNHTAHCRAGAENGFFSDRLHRELNGSTDEANVLAKALGGWTALQIIDRI